MQKQITSIDVAELAGVSQPTVSRAFDPDASVAPETRAKILDAARKLGYKPNVIARSLSTQRTNIIGLVMGNINKSLFYPNLLDALTHALQVVGKQTLIFNAPGDRSVDELLPNILGYQVDALVIASTTPSNEIIAECTQQGTPVILFNRFAIDSDASSICCDNVTGGRMVADLFLETGHEHIGYMAGGSITSTNAMREEGFAGRLRERGYMDLLRDEGIYTYQSGYDVARRMLTLMPRPDAIFCAADIMAMGAMDAVREAGLSIPQDIALVGFDDIPVAGWPGYALTTIRQPITQMVNTAVSLITSTSPRIGETHLLPGELIHRTSTRPRPGG